ncbi:MAG: hypothetical protein M5T61_20155 [Acidimicrobiia bacterium]|nr:hypothetical protein [Acidimicrobiia bacterium]
MTHQPDPTTEFTSWARFVITDEFLAKHLVGSILGLALNTIGVRRSPERSSPRATESAQQCGASLSRSWARQG